MADSAIKADVQRNVTWNFNVNLVDIIFITIGFSLISRETVMPVLVSSLTDSKIAIGLIPAVWALGYYLPQLLTASFTERLRYKKPFVMVVGSLGERLPYLLIALSIWAFALTAPTLTLTLFFFFIGMASFSAGIATPAWFDIIAKVIPVQRRGIWMGLGHGVGALLGVAAAAVVARVLEEVAYPNNFALLFALAFVFVMISFGGFALTREPPSESVKERVTLSHYLRQLPAVIRRDRNYSRFLLSRTTMQLGAMAAGFYMVFGTERFAISGAGVGLFTGVLIASVAGMNLVWGVIGDRIGHKTVLTVCSLCHGPGRACRAGGPVAGRAPDRFRAHGRVSGGRPGLVTQHHPGILPTGRSPHLHRSDQYAPGTRADSVTHLWRLAGHGGRLQRALSGRAHHFADWRPDDGILGARAAAQVGHHAGTCRANRLNVATIQVNGSDAG